MKTKIYLNVNDIGLLILLMLFVYLWHLGWQGMHTPLANLPAQNGKNIPALAYDLLRSNMRLLIGLGFSFLFAFIAGVWAAKSKHAAYFILPFINFMESVPLVGFMTFSVTIAIALYPHSVMGLEWAAIFGVFTAQAWNMALTVYQTLGVIPSELNDVARQFQMNAWQKFLKIELPYTIPGLLWNTMVSQSAAWFALVGTEAIAVGAKLIMLPGVGSYIQMGLNTHNIKIIILAIMAIILNIILFDQLFFRPLVKWAEKFKYERVRANTHASSCLHTLYVKSCFTRKALSSVYGYLVRHSHRFGLRKLTALFDITFPKAIRCGCLLLWYTVLIASIIWFSVKLFHIIPTFSLAKVATYMLTTTSRVTLAMILSLLICIPLGVWIGISPQRTKMTQPIIQIFAALPPDIFYPIMALFLLYFHYTLSWWTVPLIMMGTQWYILFNVIAGVSSLPQEIVDVAKIFSLRGWYYWR